MQPGLVPVGGEGGAGEVAVFVERTKEGVDAFSGGEAQVHVEIQARGGDAEFVRARVVVGDGAAPVAADKQIGEDEIFFAEPVVAGLKRALPVKLAAKFNHRAGGGQGTFVAVNFHLNVGVVGVCVGGVGMENFWVVGDGLDARGKIC